MKLKLYIFWTKFKAKYLFWTRLYKDHHHEIRIMKANSEHLKWTVKIWNSHKINNQHNTPTE